MSTLNSFDTQDQKSKQFFSMKEDKFFTHQIVASERQMIYSVSYNIHEGQKQELFIAIDNAHIVFKTAEINADRTFTAATSHEFALDGNGHATKYIFKELDPKRAKWGKTEETNPVKASDKFQKLCIPSTDLAIENYTLCQRDFGNNATTLLQFIQKGTTLAQLSQAFQFQDAEVFQMQTEQSQPALQQLKIA